MASTISRSAKQQTWSRDDRERQLPFIREAASMLTGARDVLDKNGKLLRIGAPGGERKPRTAVRFLRDNNITMVLPREKP